MILLGQPETVARWVMERLPDSEPLPLSEAYQAIGFLDRENRLRGGAVYYNYRDEDIEVSAVGEPGWLNSPIKVRVLFLYPFRELGCRRMTVWVARRNKPSRRFVEKLGFRLEGVRRKALPGGRDLIMYGMLAEECRWIENDPGHATQDIPEKLEAMS